MQHNKSLYDIQIEYASIISELMDADGELTPEMEFALSINKEELTNKAEAYALRIIDFNGQAELIKAESDRLAKRAKHYETTAERLKETIKAAMIQYQVEKIKTDRVTLSFRKSEVVEVPETFADEVLQFVKITAEWDTEKLVSTKEAADAQEKTFVPPATDLLQYFKLSASVDKTKMKAALKEGTTIGDVMILDKQNLQIK